MCRTLQTLITSVVCIIQTLVRLIMTTLLMVENIIRLVLQAAYNLISFLLQCISLLPICCVFIMSSKLCCLCQNSGCCTYSVPTRRGICDFIMSAITLLFIFYSLRRFGLLGTIMDRLGYIRDQIGLSDDEPYPLIRADIDFKTLSENDTDFLSMLTSTTRKKLMRQVLDNPEQSVEFQVSRPANWTTVVYYLV